MKFEITEKGVYDGKEQIPVGTRIDVELKNGKVPGFLVGKARALDEKKPAAVVNPDRKAAIVEAIKGLDPESDYTATGKPDVDAINTLMPDGFDKVTAKERDEIFAEMSKV